MTTTENPARDEYFCQLINKAESHIYNKAWLEIEKANLDKEDILSITYDSNVALQKRVEELEGVILCLFDEKVSVEDSKQIAIKAMKSITVNKQP